MFRGIKSEGRSAQNTVGTLNDGWCDREGLDGGKWSAVTTPKGRSWKKTSATLTVNYHFSDYTRVWLVNMSALRWGIVNISFTLTAVTLRRHISTRILENCVENGWRGKFTAAYHSKDTCKKGLYKKTKQKIVQKLLCVSYHHQHPQQVVFVNVHVYGTTELKRAEKHYETTCVQHPPPPVPQIIITLLNKQKDGLVPFSWFGFRVPGIVWIGSLSDLKNMAIVCVISNTCAHLLWKSTLCCMHYTNKPGVDIHTKSYQQL